MQYEKFIQLGAKFPKELMYRYESFVDGIDFEKIQKQCQKYMILNSNNDPFIPVEYATRLQKKLDCELTWFSHAGHFCKRDGYVEFWELLECID
jgi:predicted alpha/beta hydrolase family esterase